MSFGYNCNYKHMTTKPPYRAAVHGVKLPAPDIIDVSNKDRFTYIIEEFYI